MIEEIKKVAAELQDELVAIRRHLHSNPELSFQEFETSKFIQQKLKEHGIAFTADWVKTGIVAEIKGTDGKTIALRGDMDALPIKETNTVSYCSRNSGVMHACGHDVHTTVALGAAIILNKLKDKLKGTVQIVFQPGEEKLPGGAKLMLEEKAFGERLPDVILGNHVFPELQAGKVGFRIGHYMASTDEIYITVNGKGGHAALPKNYNSPLLIASKILLTLQEEFMQKEQPTATVLAFGKITGMGATNVIPDAVNLEGTFRTMDEEWRSTAHEKIKSVTENVATSMGGSADVRIDNGYPVLYNDPHITSQAISAAEEYLGKENVIELDKRMTAEDFAFFSQVIPATFYRLGTASPDGSKTSPVHTSNFDVDEKCLEVGSGLMAYNALTLLML